MASYFRVNYFDTAADVDLGPGAASHNAIVRDFEQFATLAQGRIGIITGTASASEYLDYWEAEKNG